jgi:hypothetical protein
MKAPVFQHTRVDEILVGGAQLTDKEIIEAV